MNHTQTQMKIIKTPLKQNGDFRSEESTNILKEADIVVTNPPFSLFREYIEQLMEYNKQFLIVGPVNAVKYKEIFPLIKEDKIWIGTQRLKGFLTPDKEIKGVPALWFTNLDNLRRKEDIYLYKKYQPETYLKYDNYDAIEVSKTKDIPKDYYGLMGVPITFLEKHNPNQFELISNEGSLTIKGKKIYQRFIIKRK